MTPTRVVLTFAGCSNEAIAQNKGLEIFLIPVASYGQPTAILRELLVACILVIVGWEDRELLSCPIVLAVP